MPSHEEGEFELVLGNKQLLSVFFLVILLLGVFFSMGYIVGRNTAPATTLSASSRQAPIVVEPASNGSPKPHVPDPGKPSALTPTPEPAKPEPSKPEPAKLVPVAKPEPPKPEPVKAETPKPKPEPPKVKPEPVKPEPVKPAPTATGGGTFLQVVATKRPDADKLVASLTQKGFPAKITPVPDSSLVRVVVGPLADTNAVSRTRSGLEAEGYKPIIRKF